MEGSMTNIDRAENIIYEAITGDGFLAPELSTRCAARTLAAAGLLMPDLPPVRVDDLDERPHVIITGALERHGARLRVDEHGKFHTVNVRSDPMTPAEARVRAYALLALAQHMESAPVDADNRKEEA